MTDQIPYKSQHLHIIKASAGSGKTHRLTGEYLHLLFSQPNNHRHILAVTFTNKATDEMKSRIVEELYRLASGRKSDYLNLIISNFSLEEPAVRSTAKRILETILHDYSSFSISTIDKFFQQTMRAFTREMGLAGGYNIEVDHSSLLIETVDLMLSELDKSENKQLSEWLLQFMQDSIEEGKSWKIDREVIELSKQLFNETYKSFTSEEQENIQNKEQLFVYKKILIKLIRDYENELKSVGVKAVSIMNEYSLVPSDFKGSSTSQFFKFEKIAKGEIPGMTKTFLSFPDNLDGWYTKSKLPDIIIRIENAYNAGLNECVKQVIDLYDNDIHYKTAKCILQNYYTLGILNDIKNRLKKLQQENNTLLLSDTTELLNDIISGTDSPFIYEKTGIRLTNYMIDEFQDTSRMQWNNFRPLIDESLSSGNFNLIVGDVKQSIYRFRNSDWRLLEEQVTEDFHKEYIKNHVLDTNWRSDANIVEFNNRFFRDASIKLQDYFNDSNEIETEKRYSQIADAYNDVNQLLPDKKKVSEGYVKITFFKDDNENDWEEEVLERIPHEIESLQDQGFALKEIAIVVRWNKEAVKVAERLLTYKEEHPDSKYHYDIISNEALFLGSAQSVKTILALMNHFRFPKNKLCKLTAVYEFLRLQHRLMPADAIKAYKEETDDDFPEGFRGKISELSTMPFYDMIESFFSLFTHDSDRKENAYIQSFLDIALKFSEDKSADINSFLDWWSEEGHKKALHSPEEQDAIRLMTIHKSKGLGFGAVIMPFVNWKLDHTFNPNKKDIIWCKPDVAPFNLLNVVPLKYEKKLADTIFREEYLEEKMFSYIDNLNLLYVAFTRAKHRLIVFAPFNKSANFNDVSQLMRETVSYSWLSPENFSNGNTECLFEMGSPDNFILEEKDLELKTDKTERWHSIPFTDRLKLRLNSIGYFSDDGSRDYGKLMHEIVSKVNKISDIPQAVDERISDGELNDHYRERFIEKLTEYLSIPDVVDWYNGKYEVLNEAQVLHPKRGFSRPDRVMIGPDELIIVDYKFGESENSKYNSQVRNYVKSIKEMGYPVVKGYLFYVKSGKVVAV